MKTLIQFGNSSEVATVSLYETAKALCPPITAKSALLATGFFLFATSIRWIFKSKKRNEFNESHNRETH